MRLAVFVAIVSGLHFAAPCRAQGDAPQPYQLIRALQSLQNDAAAGKTEARAAQPRLVGEIAAEFRKTAPAVWRERRNARAAIVFLLSGGPAGPIRTLLDAGVFSPPELPAMKGALAYAEGREAEAKRLLLPIDVLVGAEGIGGPLALVQAALVMHDEPKRALLLLDRARLLSPGTLIEEAALRRSVFIADETADAAGFFAFARLYRRRFPLSIYAGAVEKRLAPMAMRLAEKGGVSGEDVIGLLSVDARVELRLSIARKALLRADLPQLGAQAGLAGREAKPGSDDAARAALYDGLSRLLTDNGRPALQSIARARLSPDDAELLDAAMSVADQIRAPSASMAAPAERSEAETGTMAEASRAIRLADAMLGEAR